jgi:hypothetical protein
MPDEVGLIPFLVKAKSLAENEPFPLACLTSGAVRDGDIQFWPYRGKDEREPDAVILFTLADGTKVAIAIEAKLGGPKSQVAPISGFRSGDQLADQWQLLRRMVRQEGAKLVVVYLTSDVGMPRADIEASALAIAELDPTIAWLSWRDLYDVLTVMHDRGNVAEDLVALLDKVNLRSYSLRLPVVVDLGTWTYGRFVWSSALNMGFDWTYGHFNWPTAVNIGFDWRYRNEQ